MEKTLNKMSFLDMDPSKMPGIKWKSNIPKGIYRGRAGSGGGTENRFEISKQKSFPLRNNNNNKNYYI